MDTFISIKVRKGKFFFFFRGLLVSYKSIRDSYPILRKQNNTRESSAMVRVKQVHRLNSVILSHIGGHRHVRSHCL